MSVLPHGKWLIRLGVLGVLVIMAVQFLRMPFIRVEKGRFSYATQWFSARMRDPKAPLPDIFALTEFREGKNGWTATLTRKPKPGQTGCDDKYGCYSVTFDSVKGELTCSTKDCTEDLLP